ncbi:hypothetical protein GCM10028798_34010 [Humibacter antri]
MCDSAPGGPLPDIDPGQMVSANEHGIVASIRHAQDIDSLDDETAWAQGQVKIRLLTQEDDRTTDRREVFRGQLAIASGRISIGDAESEVIHPAHHGWNEVVVTVGPDVAVNDLSPNELQIDLIPLK